MTPRFSAFLSVMRFLISLSFWGLRRFLFVVCLVVYISLFFSLLCISAKYRLSVLYRSLVSHSRVV